MRKTHLIIILTGLLIVPVLGYAQDMGTPMKYIMDGKDTIYTDDIPPAYKKYAEKGKNKGKQWRKYYRLVHNFSKAYPYALLAKEKIGEADVYLESHNLNAREREKFLSKFQESLFDTFEKPLKNLTFSQGRLLLRLIDREVGLNSYYIIKNYRGGAAAGFWQGIAKIFGSDLKKPYDKYSEDKDTEELVLIYQKGDFNSLYISIFGKFPPLPAALPKEGNDYPQKMTRIN
jgi:hypothetical protein